MKRKQIENLIGKINAEWRPLNEVVEIVQQAMKPKAKDLVIDLLGGHEVYGKISVTKGRGTASGWKYIETDHSVPCEVRDIVERQLRKHQLCSTYFSDYGMGIDDWNPCVSWDVR